MKICQNQKFAKYFHDNFSILKICWNFAKPRNFILSKFYLLKVATDNWLFCLTITSRIDHILHPCCMLALTISFMGRKAFNIMWRIFLYSYTFSQLLLPLFQSICQTDQYHRANSEDIFFFRLLVSRDLTINKNILRFLHHTKNLEEFFQAS